MDSAVITVLVNAGVAGIVIILIITGYLVPKWVYVHLLKENEALRRDRDLQRKRAEEIEGQGEITNQLIGALVRLARSDGGENPARKDVP